MNTNRRIRDFLKHLVLAKMGVGSAKDIFFNLCDFIKKFGICLLSHEHLYLILQGSFQNIY